MSAVVNRDSAQRSRRKRREVEPSLPRVRSTLDVVCRPVIGVDPGSRWVGVCARLGRDVLDATTIDLPPPDGPDADRVRIEKMFARMDEVMDRHEADARMAFELRGERLAADVLPWRVAVEGVNRPSAYLDGVRVSSGPRVQWDAAQTLALVYAVMARYPAAVVVPPEHNGERHLPKALGAGNPYEFYPPSLVRQRPHEFLPADLADRVHERSAYDVAGLGCLRDEVMA